MPARTFTIQSASSVGLTHPDVHRVHRLLDAMHSVVPLTSVEFNVTGDPLIFAYEIVLADGRTWKQSIRFDALETDDDPGQTFDVVDFWRLSEFGTQREIRDALVHLTRGHGLISLEATWSP